MNKSQVVLRGTESALKSATICNFFATSGYALYTSAGGCHASKSFNASFIKSSSSLIGFNLPTDCNCALVICGAEPVAPVEILVQEKVVGIGAAAQVPTLVLDVLVGVVAFTTGLVGFSFTLSILLNQLLAKFAIAPAPVQALFRLSDTFPILVFKKVNYFLTGHILHFQTTFNGLGFVLEGGGVVVVGLVVFVVVLVVVVGAIK